MAQPRDYYEILGVKKTDDAETIKKAYRKLAMQFHPDKNPGDKTAEDKFKEAASAYEVLSSPDKRAKYDRFGHAAFQQGMGGGGFHSAEDVFASFSDIFGDFFGGGAGPRTRRSRSQGPTRGSDLRYISEITLKEVLHGLEKDIEFDTEESCGECEGTGAKKGTQADQCPTCGGQGQVVSSQGFFSVATTCPGCRGTGKVIRNPCTKCEGTGRSDTHRKIRVNIPAGVDTGTQLRVAGEGEGGFRGGPPGDLYVEIRVKDDERFERHGLDLLSSVQISYLQAVLGAEVEVETVEGKEKLTIPAGTAGGDRVRIEKKGIPSLRGGSRGHLYYEVEVEIPQKLKKDEEKLLREIAKIRGEKVLDPKKGIFG
jgi:molecular chaperone DnaJ